MQRTMHPDFFHADGNERTQHDDVDRRTPSVFATQVAEAFFHDDPRLAELFRERILHGGEEDMPEQLQRAMRERGIADRITRAIRWCDRACIVPSFTACR